MRKNQESKVVPTMPEGIKVTERPIGLEFMQRGNERWVLAIQALDALDATHCLEIDISGLSKNQIVHSKNAIVHAGKKLNYKPKIKFALKGLTLFVWSNR